MSATKSYPWQILYKTILLWGTYICCGMADSVRGPTLLDLSDIAQVDISEVSSIFAFKSLGGLVGSLATGLLMDYCNPSTDYIFIAGSYFIKCLMTLLLPYSVSLLGMQCIEAVYGFCHGGFHSVANQLLIRIWTGTGRNTSPYVYTLHFCYAIGALLTPIVAKPFLKDSEVESTLIGNGTMFDVTELELENTGFWTIKSLYPLIFMIMVLPVPGFIFYFIQARCNEGLKKKSEADVEDIDDEEGEYLNRNKTIAVMIFASLFYFTQAGIEHGFRSFTAVFMVNSALRLSRNAAADVLAILYLTFAAVRLLLIPISTLVSSNTILITSSLTLLVSTSMLAIWGETNLLIMQIGIGLTGAGMASMVAAGMIWLKNVIKITNKITAIILFACRVSEKVYSLLAGMLMETYPMGFLYIMPGNVVCVIACIGIMNLIVWRRRY